MNATVRDVMTSRVTTIAPETGVKEAAALLRAGGFTALPVVDRLGRVAGVLSEADLLVKAERSAGPEADTCAGRERGARWTGTLACHLMSRPAVTVSSDAPLAEAARLMLRHGLKRLPVVDGAEQPVGIVSRGDLLKVFLRSDEEVRRDVHARLAADGLAGAVERVEDGVVFLAAGLDDAAASRATGLVEAVDGVVAARRSPPSC
jgi:CBS domain-containing protein